jgi:hypothetical protein
MTIRPRCQSTYLLLLICTLKRSIFLARSYVLTWSFFNIKDFGFL